MDEIMAKLQAPFAPSEIEWRVGNTTKDKDKGMALAYVTNRAIQNRLDEVFGVFGWQNSFKEWRNSSQLCGISVLHEGQWITKWDGADDSDFESTKGGLSDAMKRAAYQWGIGRYLYKLEAQWMPIKQQGKSYVLTKTPNLPQWALPEGCEKTKAKPETKSTPNDKELPWEDPYGSNHIEIPGTEIKDTISDRQAKRLFALGKANSIPDEELKNLIGSFGYESSREIKKKDYQKICDSIEGK